MNQPNINMNSKLSLSELLGSTHFYSGQPLASKRHYAERVGKTALKRFIGIHLSIGKQRDKMSLQEVIAQWFMYNGTYSYRYSPSYIFLIDHVQRIRRAYSSKDFHLVSTEAILNMYQWLQANPDIPDTAPDQDLIMLNLFNLNLLFNDDVLANYEKATDSARRVQGDNYLQKLTLSMSFSQSDLNNINYAQLLYTQFFKALKLLEFLEATPKYQSLFQQFLADFGTKKEEYLKRLGLAVVLGSSGGDGWNVIEVPKNEYYEENCAFLDKVAITPDYDVPDDQNDYLAMRARPIERIAPGEYLCLFPLFLVKKLYNGTIFLLSDVQKKHPMLLRGSFLGHIRGEFSEEVLLYDVLNQFYVRPSAVRLTGKQLKMLGMQREPDYYLRVGNTVVLHESKDFFMAGDIKLSYDFDVIEKALQTDGKSSVPPKPDRFGKAVVQLAENIGRVIRKAIPGDSGCNVEDIEILPVIVVYDSLYNALGLNFWVHYWMEAEIAKLKALPEYASFDFDKVKPVTLVEIDSLIFYQRQFADNTLNYIELLRKYHEVVNYRKVDVKDVVQFAHQSCIPFSVFVEDYCIEKEIPPDMAALHELLIRFGVH